MSDPTLAANTLDAAGFLSVLAQVRGRRHGTDASDEFAPTRNRTPSTIASFGTEDCAAPQTTTTGVTVSDCTRARRGPRSLASNVRAEPLGSALRLQR